MGIGPNKIFISPKSRKIFLLNKLKVEPSPNVVYRQNDDSARDLGFNQLLVFAFHLFFLIAIYFFSINFICTIYFMRYLL